MALDATIGSPDSNSYVTVTEADAYFEDRVHSEAWDDFDDTASVLITSSQMLDWYVKWKGYKATSTQSMAWPRVNVTRRDGTEVDDSVIPREVKIAVFELALASLAEDRMSDDPMAGLEQVKAGTLSVKSDGAGVDSTSLDTIPDQVWNILSDLYLRGDASVVRLVRA